MELMVVVFVVGVVCGNQLQAVWFWVMWVAAAGGAQDDPRQLRRGGKGTSIVEAMVEEGIG